MGGVNLFVVRRMTRLSARSWRPRPAPRTLSEMHSPPPPTLLQGPFPKFLQGETHFTVHENICNITAFSLLASHFRKCCKGCEKKVFFMSSVHSLFLCRQKWFIDIEKWAPCLFNLQSSSSTPSLGSKSHHGHGGQLSANPRGYSEKPWKVSNGLFAFSLDAVSRHQEFTSTGSHWFNCVQLNVSFVSICPFGYEPGQARWLIFDSRALKRHKSLK